MKHNLKMKGKHTFIITNKDGSIKDILVFNNIILQQGREEIGDILAGLKLSTNGINYCGLGTGSATIADSDTSMESEGARKIRGSSQTNEDSFIVAFYFNPTEGNGTWTRYGTYIDGTETADSGVLFSHASISLTKNEGEGLTITSQYTVSDVT